MLILVLAYLGGMLTIVSPCILPVLPFVFARADQPFARSGLPLLAGMATAFTAVATLAAVGGHWVIGLNRAGRVVALAVLALMGLSLLLPRLADRLAGPFVALGNRLSRRMPRNGSPWSAAGLGVATGLLWAPCAGPILGLILTTAALQGAGAATTILLLVFGAGAATSLAFALLLGGRFLAAMRRSLGIGEHLRRGLGVLVLAGVAAIALGVDTGLLTRLSLASTARLEQALVEASSPVTRPSPAPRPGVPLPVEGRMPRLDGATGWLNSAPLTREDLHGHVVLVDFWTYSCINCLRALPHVRAWAERYRDHGLVVLGVHTPEFAFEKDPGNVAAAGRSLGIGWPVALDNDYALWQAFDNHAWPAHYVIDAEGRIRYRHFGEGDYAQGEDVIRRLLAEAGATGLPGGHADARGTGAMAPASGDLARTPETWLGYARAQRFAGGRIANGASRDYRAPSRLPPHHWALDGRWTIQPEYARLERPGGSLSIRFRGRDLHLVMAPGEDGRPVRFRVTLDGQAPGGDAGVDIDADGYGMLDRDRLYQLVRLRGGSDERVFRITFADAGARVYAVTSG